MDKYIDVLIKIKENETNIIHDYKTESLWDEDTNTIYTYIWEEGNFKCDCNRKLFFYNHEISDDELECSEDKYSVNIHDYKNGNILYKEFEYE